MIIVGRRRFKQSLYAEYSILRDLGSPLRLGDPHGARSHVYQSGNNT